MSNHKKENFVEDGGETYLKLEIVAIGADRIPLDPITGKRLSRPQLEHAKSLGTTDDAVRGVIVL